MGMLGYGGIACKCSSISATRTQWLSNEAFPTASDTLVQFAFFLFHLLRTVSPYFFVFHCRRGQRCFALQLFCRIALLHESPRVACYISESWLFDLKKHQRRFRQAGYFERICRCLIMSHARCIFHLTDVVLLPSHLLHYNCLITLVTSCCADYTRHQNNCS